MSDDREEIEEMLTEAQQDLTNEQDGPNENPKQQSVLSRTHHWLGLHKRLGLFLGLVIVALGLGISPVTRYGIVGLVIKHDVELRVVDSQNNQPVSGAEISLHGKTAKTNNMGVAHFDRVNAGVTHASVTKKYYQSSTPKITVGFKVASSPVPVSLTATGRQIPIRVANKVTGKPLAGITITAAGTDVETDSEGQATIVVDTSATVVEAELKGEGYNTQRTNLTVTQEVSANTFAMTPSGSVYFLSKKTGKIDVVKTSLDGSDRQTVLEGTGNEEVTNTVMVASRDWKFMALLARRDGTHASLYLIDTSSDKLTQIDTNDATFSLAGWSGHNFVYVSRSNTILDWQPGQTQLKTFSADTGKLTKIDDTAASGTSYTDYAAESLGNVYQLDDSVVYTKNWAGNSAQMAGKRPGLYVAKSNGNDKKPVKDFDQSYLTIVQPEPHMLYIQQNGPQARTTYYSYQNTTFKQDDALSLQAFNQFYATYLLSLSSNKTFWHEPRDGKNSLFVGDQNGKNGSEILSGGEYVTYGWYGDDYVLISKNGSELYIASATGKIDETSLQKVTDYQKPTNSYQGYGRGYGGL